MPAVEQVRIQPRTGPVLNLRGLDGGGRGDILVTDRGVDDLGAGDGVIRQHSGRDAAVRDAACRQCIRGGCQPFPRCENGAVCLEFKEDGGVGEHRGQCPRDCIGHPDVGGKQPVHGRDGLGFRILCRPGRCLRVQAKHHGDLPGNEVRSIQQTALVPDQLGDFGGALRHRSEK